MKNSKGEIIMENDFLKFVFLSLSFNFIRNKKINDITRI